VVVWPRARERQRRELAGFALIRWMVISESEEGVFNFDSSRRLHNLTRYCGIWMWRSRDFTYGQIFKRVMPRARGQFKQPLYFAGALVDLVIRASRHYKPSRPIILQIAVKPPWIWNRLAAQTASAFRWRQLASGKKASVRLQG